MPAGSAGAVRLLIGLLAAAGLGGAEPAIAQAGPLADSGRPSTAREEPRAPAAPLDRLLARIKAEHPGASILRAELRTLDLEGWWLTYEVKLLRRDGSIARMTYDARTLELIDAAGGRHGPGPHRRRERWRGGWPD